MTPQYDMLLQFAVPAGCATVTAVRLTLTVAAGATDPAVGDGEFYATDPADPNAAWSESTVAWARALASTGSPVSLTGAVDANTPYELDVTSLLPAAGGTFTIRGANTSGDGAGYWSKEGSATSGPQLALTCG